MSTTILSSRQTPTGFLAVVHRGIRVLVAGSDEARRRELERHLAERGFGVRAEDDGIAALAALRAESFDVALLDDELPRLSGLDVLRALQGETLAPQVIFVADGAGDEGAATALRLGAYDCVARPWRLAEIEALVRRAWEKRRLLLENASLRTRIATLEGDGQFVAAHASAIALRARVATAAEGDAPVLFAGEPGTGKALLARALHRRSGRARGLFVRVDCPALSDAEERIFGVDGREGSDSARPAPGLLEEAAGGTLFLAEVDALPAETQRRIVAALDARTFRRARGERDVPLAARIIASTSRDLSRAAARARFDATLLERLSSTVIAIPPLRERLVDLPLLVEQFLVQRAGPAAPRLGGDALAAMSRYAWPGNVRELRMVVERAALLATDGVIRAGDVALPGGSLSSSGDDVATLEQLERRHIAEVLERVDWHQGRAASLLGISSKTLYRKIREYGFQRPGAESEDE